MPSPCFAAWKHLSVKSANSASVCCAWNRNFKVTDWSEVETHPALLQFREDTIAQKWPKECVACQSKSAKGMSTRKDLLNADVTNDFVAAIEILEVNLTNVCNYTCVMCSSDYSSRWSNLERQMSLPTGKNGGSFRIDLATLDQLAALVQRNPVRRIEIQGGEPLLMSETFYFLRQLEEIGYAGDIWIVTNGSVVPEAFLQFAQSGLRLFVTVSLDTIDEKLYRLIRSPDVPLCDVIANIATLKKHFNNTFVSAAISNLNGYEYNEIDRFALSAVGHPVSVNWVQRPSMLQLFRLNSSQREWSLNQIRNSSHQGIHSDRISQVLTQNTASDAQVAETQDYLHKFCRLKGVSLAECWKMSELYGRSCVAEVK